MNRVTFFGTAAVVVAMGASAWAGDRMSQTFDSPRLDHFVCLTEHPGYAFRVADGRAYFTKDAGLNDSFVRLNGTFVMEGDFDARVLVHRTDLNTTGEMGLVCYYPTGNFNDVFFHGPDRINGNVYQIGGGFESVVNDAATATLRIRREGMTVTLSYSTVNGYVDFHTHTDANLMGPVHLGLFMISEYDAPEALSGWMDNFIVDTPTMRITGCEADLDDGSMQGRRDCGVTVDDLVYFLELFAAGDPGVDLDDGSGTGTHDGGVTIDDLLFFLGHYAGGC